MGMHSMLTVLLLISPLSAELDFSRDVQSILNKNGIVCHGGVKQVGEMPFIFRDQVRGKANQERQLPGDCPISIRSNLILLLRKSAIWRHTLLSTDGKHLVVETCHQTRDRNKGCDW